MQKNNQRKKLFLKFLNFYWLRPEKALLHTFRSEKYMKTFKYFKSPSLDVSCGDGVYSFFSHGGELSTECDQYQSLKKDRINNKNLSYDLYDDYKENDYKIIVKKKSKKKFDYGSDYKLNLIKKSKKLNLYRNFILHDNNKKFPSNLNKFNYIYANSAYWVKNFEDHILDLVNMTNKNGKLVLSLKGKEISKKNFLNEIKNILGNNAYKILDRGRRESWKGLKKYDYYINFLKKIKNCKIVSIEPVFDTKLLNIWDIGLRPIFKPLVLMINNKNKIQIKKSKKLLVEIIYSLFEKFIANYKPKNKNAVEWVVVLEKIR